MLAGVLLLGGFTQDDFLTLTTAQSVLDRAAVVGFLALGLTPVLIAGQSSGRGLLWWSMSAMATASIAPMILIGLVLEKYIVKGLTAGSVRG